MNLKPLYDRVVVRPIASEEKTAGGIIIPDTAQEKPLQGEVLAVGSGARNSNGDIIPLEVKKGDRVMYGKWGATEVKVKGEDLLVLKEADIIAILS